MTYSPEARPTAEHRLIVELLGRINELEARPVNEPRDLGPEWLDSGEAEARAKMAHTIAQLQAALKAQRLEISSLRERLAVAERSPKLGRLSDEDYELRLKNQAASNTALREDLANTFRLKTAVEHRLAEAESRAKAAYADAEAAEAKVVELKGKVAELEISLHTASQYLAQANEREMLYIEEARLLQAEVKQHKGEVERLSKLTTDEDDLYTAYDMEAAWLGGYGTSRQKSYSRAVEKAKAWVEEYAEEREEEDED